MRETRTGRASRRGVVRSAGAPFVIVAASALLAFSAADAAKLPGDATAIVRRGENQMRGKSVQALMSMKIVRPSFERELQLRLTTEGTKNAIVTILKPAKEEGITSLRTDTQMWNYLPKTDQTVRVPTSLMLQSWMGSDFTNDDLMKMSSLSDDYSHRTVKQEVVKGQPTYLIECLPKPQAAVVWGKILLWARTSDSLPVREEYYDERGKLVRTMELDNFRKMDDRIIPTELTISKAGDSVEKTTVVYERVLYDRTIDKAIFGREHLRNTSRKNKDISRGWLTQGPAQASLGT